MFGNLRRTFRCYSVDGKEITEERKGESESGERIVRTEHLLRPLTEILPPPRSLSMLCSALRHACPYERLISEQMNETIGLSIDSGKACMYPARDK